MGIADEPAPMLFADAPDGEVATGCAAVGPRGARSRAATRDTARDARR
jgi:hypothetical protein